MKPINLFICLVLSALQGSAQVNRGSDLLQNPANDSLIRECLVHLALANPAMESSDAMVGQSEYELKRAKASWLNTINLSGNINEFVINNTTINGLNAATLYPKYNVGVTVPLGIFGRQEKNIAKEKLRFFGAQKQLQERDLIEDVMIGYENYKEKLDLLELQKQVTNGQYSSYQQKQNDYATGDISDIKEVNKEYELWIDQRGKQRTKEKELKVAEIELEQIIGMKINDAIKSALVKY